MLKGSSTGSKARTPLPPHHSLWVAVRCTPFSMQVWWCVFYLLSWQHSFLLVWEKHSHVPHRPCLWPYAQASAMCNTEWHYCISFSLPQWQQWVASSLFGFDVMFWERVFELDSQGKGRFPFFFAFVKKAFGHSFFWSLVMLYVWYVYMCCR